MQVTHAKGEERYPDTVTDLEPGDVFKTPFPPGSDVEGDPEELGPLMLTTQTEGGTGNWVAIGLHNGQAFAMGMYRPCRRIEVHAVITDD